MKRMRKAIALLLVFCACCAVVPASGEEIASDLLAVYQEQSGGDLVTDYVEFTTPDGVRYAFVLSDWWLYGYAYRDGTWQNVRSGSALYGGAQARFQRHDAQALRADGSAYPDEFGFDILAGDGEAAESYHYNGEYFELCGWVDTRSYHGSVIIDGTTLSYYPFSTAQAEYAVDTQDEMALASWVYDFERHPATPEEAKKRAALLESAMADDFPGYTLLSHEMYNWGTLADAGYYRIQDGRLVIKRVTYDAQEGCIGAQDMAPVPLSGEMLARLKCEPAQTLIDASGYGSVLRADDGLDTQKIPVSGTVLTVSAQQGGLILLAEDGQGERRLYWATVQPDGSYAVKPTQALPDNVSLDLFHAGSDEVSFEWGEYGQDRQAGYKLGADGSWMLEWVMNSAENGSMDYSFVYCGVKLADSNQIRIGSLKGADLFETELDSLPQSEAELRDALDRGGWAVVHNPNPADRLHLRTKPERGAQSLGKFYNGTPVQVLDNMGEWCRVRIGLDGRLEGYMMTKFLTFGEDMDGVARAFPDKFLREEHEYAKLYADAQLSGQTESLQNAYSYWIVGVVDDELYIVLTQDGATGYAPQAWFFEGNG